MELKSLIGSGDKIGMFVLPFLIIGLILNFLFPDLFILNVSANLKNISLATLSIGVIIWAWSVVLILTKVPKKQLITTGPYWLVKHPLYTAVGLIVLPSLGLLFSNLLWILIGVILYIASRKFSPEEEQDLAKTFGPRWNTYSNKVLLPWV